MLQSTAVFGVFGLSFFTAFAAAIPAALSDDTAATRAKWLCAAAYGLLAMFWIAGQVRLWDAPRDMEPGVRLRLIQPNVAQSNKWAPELRVEIMRLLIEMSVSRPKGEAPTHIIWPETATPEFLAEYPDDIAVLGRLVPKGGALITGSPRIERRGPGDITIWNSVHVIDDEARITATYDKAHLVPFGEYLPFPNWLGVRALAAGRVDFTPGPGLAALDIPGAPDASPLICYEAIFPAHVVPPSELRPRWLLNLTNDAWFGISTGPYQHAAMVRLRAVEEGMPLVRVANNGVSAVFDGYGRVVASADLGDRAVLDADLPRALAGRTPFSFAGNWSLLLLVLIYVSVFPLFSKSRIRATFRGPTIQ
jgi:apolipoprotein N-acyltransferase